MGEGGCEWERGDVSGGGRNVSGGGRDVSGGGGKWEGGVCVHFSVSVLSL